jgi:tetratricopeptide (TPR) repeat protein
LEIGAMTLRFTRRDIVLIAFPILLVQALLWIGLPPETVLIILAGAVLLMLLHWIGGTLLLRRHLRWFLRLQRYLMNDRPEALIEEALARRAQGDRSPENAITLAEAYSHRGLGAQAEPYALEAIELVEQRGVCHQRRTSSQVLCDAAYLARYGAWLRQGRYTEAAQSLQARLPASRHPNLFLAFMIWAYFLAGDHYNVGVLLDRVQTDLPQRDEGYIHPRYRMVLAYIRYKLLDEDPRPVLRKHRRYLEEWEKLREQGRASATYERVGEMLAEMRALLGTSDAGKRP